MSSFRGYVHIMIVPRTGCNHNRRDPGLIEGVPPTSGWEEREIRRIAAPAVDLKHRCRILSSRGSRGASCGKGRARLRKVQSITDRGPGTCSRRRGNEPTKNPPRQPSRGPKTSTPRTTQTRTHQRACDGTLYSTHS